MKYLINLFVSLALSITCMGQSSDYNKTSSLSDVIKDISFFWKLDSLGNNGFRLSSYRRVLQAKIDTMSVDADRIKVALGSPNQMWTTGNGIEWIYHYRDGRLIKPSSPDCGYIRIRFNQKTHVVEISSGHLDF